MISFILVSWFNQGKQILSDKLFHIANISCSENVDVKMPLIKKDYTPKLKKRRSESYKLKECCFWKLNVSNHVLF